jgi:hypothetical protein
VGALLAGLLLTGVALWLWRRGRQAAEQDANPPTGGNEV